MTTQIPIYRAKKINSDEWVEGYLVKVSDTFYIRKEISLLNAIIDPNTLAIHFDNMVDKNGKRIFASLSEDGIGGDIALFNMDDTYYKIIYDGIYGVGIKEVQSEYGILTKLKNLEAIGIHKGE